MSNWFTRLFNRDKGLVGQRLHAWHFTPYGRARVAGEVVADGEDELTIDPSAPERQDFRAFVKVWRHDARRLSESLPVYPMEDSGT